MNWIEFFLVLSMTILVCQSARTPPKVNLPTWLQDLLRGPKPKPQPRPAIQPRPRQPPQWPKPSFMQVPACKECLDMAKRIFQLMEMLLRFEQQAVKERSNLLKLQQNGINRSNECIKYNKKILKLLQDSNKKRKQESEMIRWLLYLARKRPHTPSSRRKPRSFVSQFDGGRPSQGNQNNYPNIMRNLKGQLARLINEAHRRTPPNRSRDSELLKDMMGIAMKLLGQQRQREFRMPLMNGRGNFGDSLDTDDEPRYYPNSSYDVHWDDY